MTRPAKRSGLFYGFWFEVGSSKRLRRVKRSEYAMAYRLWAVHADIRNGKALVK